MKRSAKTIGQQHISVFSQPIHNDFVLQRTHFYYFSHKIFFFPTFFRFNDDNSWTKVITHSQDADQLCVVDCWHSDISCSDVVWVVSKGDDTQNLPSWFELSNKIPATTPSQNQKIDIPDVPVFSSECCNNCQLLLHIFALNRPNPSQKASRPMVWVFCDPSNIKNSKIQKACFMCLFI